MVRMKIKYDTPDFRSCRMHFRSCTYLRGENNSLQKLEEKTAGINSFNRFRKNRCNVLNFEFQKLLNHDVLNVNLNEYYQKDFIHLFIELYDLLTI